MSSAPLTCSWLSVDHRNASRRAVGGSSGVNDRTPIVVRLEISFSRLNGVLVAILERTKPPGFIFHKWTADGTSELFAMKRRSRAASIKCRGQPLQVAIPFIKKCRAVVFIPARFCDHIDDAVAGTAYLGGEPARSNLKLLDRILRKICEGAAHNFVIVVAPIDGDISTAAKSARGADFESVRFRWVEVRCGPVARDEVGELQKISAVQGNILDGR